MKTSRDWHFDAGLHSRPSTRHPEEEEKESKSSSLGESVRSFLAIAKSVRVWFGLVWTAFFRVFHWRPSEKIKIQVSVDSRCHDWLACGLTIWKAVYNHILLSSQTSRVRKNHSPPWIWRCLRHGCEIDAVGKGNVQKGKTSMKHTQPEMDPGSWRWILPEIIYLFLKWIKNEHLKVMTFAFAHNSSRADGANRLKNWT